MPGAEDLRPTAAESIWQSSQAAILRSQPTAGTMETVEWAQAATIVSALAAFTALQAFWISRALDRVYARLDRIDTKLDRVDAALRDLGERVMRLEAAHTAER